MDLLDRLLSHASEQGISLVELGRRESFAIEKQWTSIFARFAAGTPHKHGAKGVAEWLNTHEENLILLFLSSRIDAFPLSTNSRPCSAYRYAGSPIDLSAFHDLEFALFPTDYAWTLVHTHEDGAMGGPYFIRADDLTPPNGEL